MTTRWTQALIDCPTTGCFEITARQDGVQPGVEGSRRMAETDLGRAVKILDRFKAVAQDIGLPAALLAAIASRESRCGAALDANGYGDNGNAYGIMQIDGRYHIIDSRDGPNGLEHILQASKILATNLEGLRFRRLKVDWPDWALLKGAVAAYNSGILNVQTIEHMDIGTTGNDYGSDVIARAQHYLYHPEFHEPW